MNLVPLNSILTFHRGITFKPDDKVEVGTADSVVCLRTKNIQKELDESDLLAVPSSFVKRDELYVKEGDILISTANSWELVGKCVRVKTTRYKSTIGGFISMLRPKVGLVDPDYLFYFLSMDKTQKSIRHLGKQTTNISNLDRVGFLQLKIPLPPLETQKQIAAVLEKADQLRKDCKLLEQELNSLAQSVFIDMFGDPVTNPRGFDFKPLRELVSVLSGATPSKSNDNFWIGNVPWVSPKDMKVSEIYDSIDHVNEIAFTETNLKKIPLNSILIVVRGMILVHTVPLAITRKNLSINQDIKALTVKCNSIKSEFLLAVLSSMHSHLLSIISTAAHGTKRIDMADLLDLKIIVPSIQQQDQFIKTVITMRNMTATQQAEATLYENNFNALMQKAFNGKLNLANAKT
ncbi:restriction endonuclease subunit S [Shewanella xiamenensis]|uniref:restriction endonuclease subunit S n=1 Tax=Shewanella xiamenensis TaxID=332186 RepID=UPI0020B13473|nr:restriction endonuclease subunit S [Shewanella xiamenensis]